MTKTKPHLSDDWETIKGSCLLSSDRAAQIETEVAARTKPLVTSGGTVVANAHTLTYPDGKSYLVTVTDYADIKWHQKNLIAALLTPEEIEMLNDLASSRWAAQTEKARFEKATKISDRDYSGGVWWGDEYFSEMEEMLDKLMWDCDDPEDIPEYVWAVTPTLVVSDLSVDDLLEHHIDNHGWEGMTPADLHETADLQAALNSFVEANKGVYSYLPDYKTAVVLSPETRAELIAQIAEQTKGGF